MSKPKTIQETPLSMIEVSEEIENIKKRDKEPNSRVAKTEEYLNQFLTKDKKEGKEMIKKLMELKIPRLKENHIYKIADLMPHKPELVKLIFQGTPITITDENCRKIVKVVQDYKK